MNDSNRDAWSREYALGPGVFERLVVIDPALDRQILESAERLAAWHGTYGDAVLMVGALAAYGTWGQKLATDLADVWEVAGRTRPEFLVNVQQAVLACQCVMLGDAGGYADAHERLIAGFGREDAAKLLAPVQHAYGICGNA